MNNWELSPTEKTALTWLTSHGFTAKIKRQYLSKTILTVAKDDRAEDLTIPAELHGESNIDSYLKMWLTTWDLAWRFGKC